MKTATLNIKLSQQLYEKIKEEAAAYEVSMAEFVRASMARQIFGLNNHTVMGEPGKVDFDKDSTYIFELGKKKENESKGE
jgi:hypothetical protein